MKSSFGLGILFTFFTMALMQDYLGQEHFIQAAQKEWVDIYWAWWLIPMVLVMICHRSNQRYNKAIVTGPMGPMGSPGIAIVSVDNKDPQAVIDALPNNLKDGTEVADAIGNHYLFKNKGWYMRVK